MDGMQEQENLMKFGTLGMEPLQGAWPQSRASYIQTLFNSNSTPVQ